MLIDEKYATLKELEEYYSFEDVLNLLEILLIKRSNEALVRDEMQKYKKRI